MPSAKGGKTQFIRIESLAGEPCRLVTDLSDPRGAGVKVSPLGQREFELDLKRGQAVVLTSGGANIALTLGPVPAQKDRENYYGLNARTSLGK